MEKIFALIKNNQVENTIVADEVFIQTILSQWDACIRIDQLDPRPGIGWAYENNNFIDPNPPVIFDPVE